MNAVIHANIVLPDRILPDASILFDEKIFAIEPGNLVPEGTSILDAQGGYVTPGLIDTHIHGFGGADASDGSTEGLLKMASLLPQYGVTCFFPTTMTVSRTELDRAFSSIREAMKETAKPGSATALIAGCHAEGPFISPSKCGAQDPACAISPELNLIEPYLDVIRILTLAPELEGAEKLIRTLREKTDLLISVGHTSGGYDEAANAYRAGATRVTHLFNAMTPLTHRAPGTVGAALSLPFFTELIADNIHVSPVLYPILDRLKEDKLILITDCTRAGGLPDGRYTLGGQEFIKRDGACRLENGTLAGSVLTMDRAVRDLFEAGIPLNRAVSAATLSAARSARLENTGLIREGFRADLVVWDRELHVKHTLREGRSIFSAE